MLLVTHLKTTSYGDTSNFFAVAAARNRIDALLGVDIVFIGVMSSLSSSMLLSGDPLSTTFSSLVCLAGVDAADVVAVRAFATGSIGWTNMPKINEIKNNGDTSKRPRPPPMMTALIKGSSVTPNS